MRRDYRTILMPKEIQQFRSHLVNEVYGVDKSDSAVCGDVEYEEGIRGQKGSA